MENVVSSARKRPPGMFQGQYRGKKVLVTGHTGFKGAWLTEWLLMLGANVTGLALEPPTNPALFDQLGIASRIKDVRADIRDMRGLVELITAESPDCIFHLAAQPLVRHSYSVPVETFEVNVLGSIHVMEAVRQTRHPCAVVMISSDKCYENREWLHAYRENEAMGGHDPYSASKGCAEIAISSYRRSFFDMENSSSPGGSRKVALASARAGNVIGGGDWAADRIVPDCIRALEAGAAIPVRNKTATRPWQHVLEPLSGYLWLGASLMKAVAGSTPTGGHIELGQLCSGINFGPLLDSNRTVRDLVGEILKLWPGTWIDKSDPNAPYEAGRLNLAIDKAFHLLCWRPVWNFEETIRQTVAWYKAASTAEGGAQPPTPDFTRRQIEAYCDRAAELHLPWMSK